MKVQIPYDKRKLEAELRSEDYGFINLLEAKEYKAELSEQEIVEQSLANPIGSERLRDMAAKVSSVLLITNDITRPMPSKITIPALIREVQAGNPNAKITVLIASGLHRAMTREELIDKMGEDVVNTYDVRVHNAYDADSLVYKGETRRGTPMWLNKAVDEHDLVISEGFIEAHWLAGFSGGRKSIMPGICGCDTVMVNHGPRTVDHPKTYPGSVEGNPAHEDFCDAAKAARLTFIMNVVLDADKHIIYAVSGDTYAAHASGCDFVRSIMGAPCEKADITISSNGGYPLDLNLYQSVKGIDTASVCTRDGGVIIMCSGCREGIGHGGFFKVFELGRGKSVQEILDDMYSGKIKEYDEWGSQLMLNAAKRFKVIIVSDNVTAEDLKLMFLDHATTLPEALEKARAFIGKEKPTINVIPEGPVIIPQLKN